MRVLSFLTLFTLLSMTACSHHHGHKSCGSDKEKMSCTKEDCKKPCCDKDKVCKDGSCTKKEEMKSCCKDDHCDKKKK